MQKRILIGLILVGLLVVVAINAAPEGVDFNLFGVLKWHMKTVYALLASGAVGIAVGVMVRS